jgi:hypothetical protein
MEHPQEQPEEQTGKQPGSERKIMSLFPADDGRLQEMILHIVHCCEDMDTFDANMLNRILFQADFLHFRRHGFPITGQAYRRGIRTPFPKNLLRVCRSMIQAQALEPVESPLGDGLHIRKSFLALREPSLQIFDGREIGLVDFLIRSFREAHVLEKPWPDLVNVPWESARYREEIPYALALIEARDRSGPFTDAARVKTDPHALDQSLSQSWTAKP